MNRIIMLAALAAAPALAPAMAQNREADYVQVVSYADLDLTREADIRTLDRRIRSAVEEVCGDTSSTDPQGSNEVRRCRARTIERLSVERSRAIALAERPARMALAAED